MSGDTRYCSKCGSALTEGAAFCPKCGAPVVSAQTAGAPSRREYRYEKQEKHEKQEKGEKSEKGEKGRRGDITGAIVGGLVLIWLGISFYLQQISAIPSDRWWAYFLAGLGVIIIIQGLIRYSQGRRPFVGSLIAGAILTLLGYSFLTNALANFWPLVLVVIGIAVLASSLAARRRTPSP